MVSFRGATASSVRGMASTVCLPAPRPRTAPSCLPRIRAQTWKTSLVNLLTIAAVVFRSVEGEVLTVRKRGTDRFMLVGGKLEPGESPAAAAVRETVEETGLLLEDADLTLLGRFVAPAANEPDTEIECTVYTAPLTAAPVLAAEIAELRWLDPARADEYADLAPLLTEQVLPALAQLQDRPPD